MSIKYKLALKILPISGWTFIIFIHISMAIKWKLGYMPLINYILLFLICGFIAGLYVMKKAHQYISKVNNEKYRHLHKTFSDN